MNGAAHVRLTDTCVNTQVEQYDGTDRNQVLSDGKGHMICFNQRPRDMRCEARQGTTIRRDA